MALPIDMFPKVLAAIDLIGKGKMESVACDEADISVSAFRAYINSSSEVADLYHDAMVRGYDRLADELSNIHTWGDREGVTDVKMLTLISKNRQWLLTKRRPLQYGERSIVEHNITADRAIIEALSQGKQRALEGHTVPPVIDGEYTLVEPSVKVHGVELDPDLLEFVG